MKYVLFYRASEDVETLAPAHFGAHSEWADKFHATGELLLLGTFQDPKADGAMAVFVSAESAKAFAEADPFVTHGVVSSWSIKGWNEVLAP